MLGVGGPVIVWVQKIHQSLQGSPDGVLVAGHWWSLGRTWVSSATHQTGLQVERQGATQQRMRTRTRII